MTDPNGVPEWWSENERLKAEMGLPEYKPPRFSDGTYAYEVVDSIEEEHDCQVRFIGVNTRYEDDWEVRVDGTTAFEVGRRRDDYGNTVYGLTAREFRDAIVEYVRESEGNQE